MVPAETRLTLASASPRRVELLRQIGIGCIVRVADVDEDSIRLKGDTRAPSARSHEQPPGSSVPAAPTLLPTAASVAEARARLKAAAVIASPGTLGVLAADTVVHVDGTILDKPGSASEARDMMQRLSGRRHEVFTGVAFRPVGGRPQEVTDIGRAEVVMTTVSDPELQRYLAVEDWRGVAGAYRIQGAAGAYVTELHGSYSAVVGLPLGVVYSIIRRFLEL